MALSRSLTRALRSLDRHELRQVLILVGGLLQACGDDAGTSEAVANGVTYRLEAVKCGKPGCSSCPHGPYWYAYYREGNRLRSRYVGRDLPASVKGMVEGDLSE